MEALDSQVDESLPSVSFIQENQFPPLGLAGEVELSDHPIIVDGIVEETAVVSCALQGIPSSSSTSPSSFVSSTPQPSSDVPQGSADLSANSVMLKGNGPTVPGSVYSGSVVQQIQAETTQVVAIIPSQVRLLPKAV